jgi:hypothetical protein
MAPVDTVSVNRTQWKYRSIMADPDVPPELAALHAAITEFIRERREWPPERHEQAQRDIAAVQVLLERAASELGVTLITTDEINKPDKPSLQ